MLLYVATESLGYVLAGLGAFALGGVAAYRLFGHVQDRVSIWIDPGLGAGAWLPARAGAHRAGRGGGSALASGYGYPDYIPAVHTDFVIAAIGEELGLLGSLAVVALFLLLVYRGFRIALRAPDAYLQSLAQPEHGARPAGAGHPRRHYAADPADRRDPPVRELRR